MPGPAPAVSSVVQPPGVFVELLGCREAQALAYWAVAQTETQREHIARMFLMREQFETYMPRIRRQGKITPLFPSYLIFRIESAWYRARWTPHITRVLMDGEQPARLADDVVDSIRGREVGGVVVLPRAPRMAMGQRVRITARGSPFDGLFGIYDGMIGRDRERVLLDLLGRKTAVVLAARNVVAS